MIRNRRRIADAGFALAVMLVAAACITVEDPQEFPDPSPAESSTDDADSRAGGTLRVGLAVDPVSIDPRFVVDDEGELIVDALFDPLVRLDERLGVVPAAAERWEIDDGGRTFTFELREATFHDGTPVTAEDFRRSFDRIADGTADPRSFLGYLLEGVEGADAAQERGEPLAGVEVVDDRTLVIRLSEPDPGFVETLSDPSLVPVPAEADEDQATFATAPIGNGPFAMAGAREPNTFVRLTRFEEHHEPALLDEVLLTIYPEDRDRERQWEDLQDGQLQVAEVPPERREDAEELFGRSPDGYRGPGLLDGITSTVYLYGFDTTQPPFDDPRVRRAISLAIDREALADEVMLGTREAATSIVPPPLLGARPGSCADCRHDPEAAAALLDEVRQDAASPDESAGAAEDQSGGGDAAGDVEPTAESGTVAVPADDTDPTEPDDQSDADGEPGPGDEVLERLTLTHNRGVTHAAIAERMATDIEDALGIEVDFQARDLQDLVRDVRSGEIPVFRLGWDTNEPHPGAYLHPLFHSSQVGMDNLMQYADPDVDALLDEARATEDPQQRLTTYGTAERRVLADMPALPLLWYRHTTVVAPEVQDLVYSPFGRIDLARVWLDPDAA